MNNNNIMTIATDKDMRFFFDKLCESGTKFGDLTERFSLAYLGFNPKFFKSGGPPGLRFSLMNVSKMAS